MAIISSEIHGVREFIVNLILKKQIRQEFLKDPKLYIENHKWVDLTANELQQIMDLKVEDWDNMQLKDLNDWLEQIPFAVRIINRDD